MFDLALISEANNRSKELAAFAERELRGRLNELAVNASLDVWAGREPQFDLTAVAHAIRDLRGQLDELAVLLELEE